MDIYDNATNHIAKLRRNAWVFNNKDRFEITTSPDSLKLIDKISKDLLVEVNVLSKDKILIAKGNFYTKEGQLLEITPDFWRIKGLTMSGNVFDGCGTAVAIG